MTAAPHPDRPMRLLVTGGSGVLGRALRTVANDVRLELHAPGRSELDLFDPDAVTAAARGADGIIHLATRIRSLDLVDEPWDWIENDRLRRDGSRILVDAALAVGATVYVQPTVTFVYPDTGTADEHSPVIERPILRSALAAEHETMRFARHGGRGVVLRLGLLDGPGTGNDGPVSQFGATLDVRDAATALVAALAAPSGIYNVCRDGERVRNHRFSTVTGWRPHHVPQEV